MPDPTWTVSEDGVLLASVSGCEAPYRFARNRSDLSDAEYDALVECVRKAEHHDQLAAELDRIRPLIGQHDPTGADHMEDAARLAEETDRLRVERDAAYAALEKIDENGCYTAMPGDGRCLETPEDEGGVWCDPCIARDAITRARQGHDT